MPQPDTPFYTADTQIDYNYVVDSLEDEHERRTVHTTKAPKYKENTELYSEHYNKSLRVAQDYMNIKGEKVISRSRSRSPSESNVRYLIAPIKRGRPSKKDQILKLQHQKGQPQYQSHNDKTNASNFFSKFHRQDQKQQQNLQELNQSLCDPIFNKSQNNFKATQNNFNFDQSKQEIIPVKERGLEIQDQKSQLANRFQIGNKEVLPSFDQKLYSNNSFGQAPTIGSLTLNDLLLKKQQEQNIREAVSHTLKKEASFSTQLPSDNSSLKQCSFNQIKSEVISTNTQKPKSNFAESVNLFISPLKTSQPQPSQQLSVQGILPSAGGANGINNPFAFVLPDLTSDKNTNKFPSFFVSKSASFDVSAQTEASANYQPATPPQILNNQEINLENNNLIHNSQKN